MKCIKNLLLISALAFNMSAFADDSFTFDVGSEYDATNSAVFIGKTSMALGEDKVNALAVELSAGEKTMRTNITYGFLLSGSHLFKITNDFLYQKLSFDFGQDFGKHDEQVYQNAFGAAYRYDLGGSMLKGLEVSSYFSYAPSKTSAHTPLPFIYSPTEQEGLYDVIEFHGRLAGSHASHTSVGIDVSPFKDSLLTIGADYDTITFDNKWSKKVSQNNFGGHVELDQVVLPWLKATSHYRFAQMNESYGGGFSALVPSPKDVQFELLGDVSYENNTVLDRKNTLGKLTLRANLWVEKPTTSYANTYDKKSLLSWVQDPVVRMRDVMILPEMQYTKDKQVDTYLSAPSSSYLRKFSEPQSKYGIWRPTTNDESFDMSTASFEKIDYTSGFVYAHYNDDSGHRMTLRYIGSRKPIDTVGDNWTGSNGKYVCTQTSASACKFKVKL